MSNIECDSYQKNLFRIREEKNFLEQHISKLARTRVLFLPGVEGKEIVEVFDPLGIPRANLFGVERDYNLYVEVKKKFTDVQITCMDITTKKSLKELVDSKIRFDIVHYDACGEFGSFQDLLMVLTHFSLADNCIVMTNCMAKREKAKTTQAYQAALKKYYPDLPYCRETKSKAAHLAVADILLTRFDIVSVESCYYQNDSEKGTPFFPEMFVLKQRASYNSDTLGADISSTETFGYKCPERKRVVEGSVKAIKADSPLETFLEFMHNRQASIEVPTQPIVNLNQSIIHTLLQEEK